MLIKDLVAASSREESRPAELWFCITLLVAASASASLVFSCATPFAAFAVLAATILPLRAALLTTVAVWLVNQAIGYGLLGYPRTFNSAMWGFMIGVAVVIATLAASLVVRCLAGIGRFAAYPIALIVSFATYELSLVAATPMLGDVENFSIDIVGSIAFLNALWLVGLVAVYEAARIVDGMTGRHALR